LMMAVKDAQVLKAYAAECETEAQRVTETPRRRIAA
jgi:hypothetical protein